MEKRKNKEEYIGKESKRIAPAGQSFFIFGSSDSEYALGTYVARCIDAHSPKISSEKPAKKTTEKL